MTHHNILASTLRHVRSLAPTSYVGIGIEMDATVIGHLKLRQPRTACPKLLEPAIGNAARRLSQLLQDFNVFEHFVNVRPLPLTFSSEVLELLN